MAIENNYEIPISYECSDLINEVKNDILEFGGATEVDAACRLDAGVKVIFDYIYDKNNKELLKDFPKLADDEWFERMSLNSLLNYLEILNSVI